MNRIASAALVVALGATAYAHHSHPDFLADQRVSIDGTIEFLQYVNPHSLMMLRTSEGTLYSIELPAAGQLRLPGTNCAEPIRSDTLKVGDRLIVTGIPAMDPLRHALLMRNMVRPSDGWERFHEGPHCRN